MKTPCGDVICRAILLQVSADLPAQAMIANIKQFNVLGFDRKSACF